MRPPASIDPTLWPLWGLWYHRRITRAEFDTLSLDEVLDMLDTIAAFESE